MESDTLKFPIPKFLGIYSCTISSNHDGLNLKFYFKFPAPDSELSIQLYARALPFY